MQEKTFSQEWLGRTLTIKTGKLAQQADACVTVQYGETVVMATVVESKYERDIDFFPLMVDVEERLYAAGIIKGSRFIKREGRPSDDSVLTGRMIDRSIRPLFDDSSRFDIQVILTVLSVDGENDYDIVGLIAASAALSISGVKWSGPISGVRVGKINEKLVFNPTYEQQVDSKLDLIVVGVEDRVIMIEAGAQEIPENEMCEAILEAKKVLQGPMELIHQLKADVSAPVKREIKKLRDQEEIDAEQERDQILDLAQNWLRENTKNILFNQEYYTKGERKMAVSKVKEGLAEYLFEQDIKKSLRDLAVKKLVQKQIDHEITEALVNEKRRVDGRALDQIRELKSDIEILPRNHGAGLFSRGETQIMSIVTLDAPGKEQIIEDMEGEQKKRYMHHYNFPPYSVGETRPMRGPGRREVGHGALAEKALIPVLPDKETFPYTIRVVSETLGSNGSSSMGSTCASSLALMDAGVPIKKSVGGIAMGLASTPNLEKWVVLTDIQDLEDGDGGMDFKITGTRDGLTAIQLDTKTLGINDDIIKQVFVQGRKALNQVLDSMEATISKPKPDLSKYAPRIISFRIDPEKIRDVIGTGGKVINEIIDTHQVSIDIEDDGLVMICGTDAEHSQKAVEWVKNIAREFKSGEVFTGKVMRILDFGVFVALTPYQDGMVHVSKMAPYHVTRPNDLVKVGDMVTVKIEEIDDQGRLNLTMKDLNENIDLWKARQNQAKTQAPPTQYRSRFSKMSGERIQRVDTDRNRFKQQSNRFKN